MNVQFRKLKIFSNEKTNYFPNFLKFIIKLHFVESKINCRVVPFSSIVGAGKLLDYIYMKVCICQNMRDVPFSKLSIQIYVYANLTCPK